MSGIVVPIGPQDRRSRRAIAGMYITDGMIYTKVAWVENSLLPFDRYKPIIVDIVPSVPNIAINSADQEIATKAIEDVAEQLAQLPLELDAIGIGCFGPFETIDVAQRPTDDDIRRSGKDIDYGWIRESSIHKQLSGVSVYALVARVFADKGKFPDIRIQTDVAVSGFAEAVFDQFNLFTKFREDNHDHVQQLDPLEQISAFAHDKASRYWADNNVLVCFKASVGVGGAVISQREFWPPNRYSEMGHIHVAPHRDEKFTERSDVHKGFLENYVSEGAIERRLRGHGIDVSLSEIRRRSDYPGWGEVAYYMAQACIAATMTASPDKIVLTGKVIRTEGLMRKIRDQYLRMFRANGMRSYISHRPSWNTDDYIVEPSKKTPGAYGALFFAASFLGDR